MVHAQNIKTVGNLSALSKDQIEKLPIRSPKVSTLRRVLRNFSENRAPKSPKFNQLRGNVSKILPVDNILHYFAFKTGRYFQMKVSLKTETEQ